ncbi:GntR family transcriptional regulator [Martelella radicis]|uniref:GntR family transcriptional regulator n=1 Tax=Martelella radicis TaxID=1397476 RepID=A0A7W6P866_9HYPH|nr:GntR family transcriptional regulator [Martelella radicis]MBB4120907.1 GntR family transcriptional regulator [Martelella radicis]
MSAPRHKLLTRSLREEITSGRWKVGDRLPPEVEFAVERGVSRTTLRRALSELEAEGLVARRKRVGTVIASQTPQQHFRMATNSMPELMRVTRETVLEVWTSRHVENHSDPALGGHESATGFWLEVIGVRRIPGRLRPFNWSRMFVAGPYAGIEPSLSRHRVGSVYNLIEEMFDRPIVRVSQSANAIACPQPAADAIGLSEGTPVLSIEAELYSHNGELVEISQAIYDPARFQLRNDVLLK